MVKATAIKRSLSIALFSLGILSCSPQASESEDVTPSPVAEQVKFALSTDYEIVRDVASAEPQVVEHFSLYCGHCYASESLFSQLKSKLDKGIGFERSHVLFFPQDNKDYARNMTFAFAAATQLGIEEQFVAKVFDYHFVDKAWLGDLNDLKNIFVVLGISGKDFEKTINSEQTLNRVKTMTQQAQDDKVRFTPDLIVNNKYRVKLSSLRQSNDQGQRLTALVSHLLTNP